MNNGKKMLQGLREICKILGVTYKRDYIEKRTEGAYTVKLYAMYSPDEMGCAALVAKANQLGASACGFKEVDHRRGLVTVWSFIVHVPPPAAPRQLPLLTAERWNGTMH